MTRADLSRAAPVVIQLTARASAAVTYSVTSAKKAAASQPSRMAGHLCTTLRRRVDRLWRVMWSQWRMGTGTRLCSLPLLCPRPRPLAQAHCDQQQRTQRSEADGVRQPWRIALHLPSPPTLISSALPHPPLSHQRPRLRSLLLWKTWDIDWDSS